MQAGFKLAGENKIRKENILFTFLGNQQEVNIEMYKLILANGVDVNSTNIN